MKITFLGQGFESSSADAIGNYLITYLNEQNFHSFTGISAFASETGIFGLSGHIQTTKNAFKNLTLIVGIDQEGNSKIRFTTCLIITVNLLNAIGKNLHYKCYKRICIELYSKV